MKAIGYIVLLLNNQTEILFSLNNFFIILSNKIKSAERVIVRV